MQLQAAQLHSANLPDQLLSEAGCKYQTVLLIHHFTMIVTITVCSCLQVIGYGLMLKVTQDWSGIRA